MTTGTSNSTLAKGDRSTEEDVEPIEAEWNGQEIPSRDDTSTIHTAMDFYDQVLKQFRILDSMLVIKLS